MSVQDATTREASLSPDEQQLEEEMIFNERVVEHEKLGKIKLSRPTPRIQRLISDERRKQFHRDYVDDTILSKQQVAEIAKKRGDWSDKEEDEMTRLYERVGQIIGILDFTEYDGLEGLLKDYEEVAEKLEEEFEGNEEVRENLDRFFNLDEDRVTSDRVKLQAAAGGTAVIELLDEAELIRGQIDLLFELVEARSKLNELQERHGDLFHQSVESRADQAEEMARLYYCAVSEDTGERLWESVDAMWDEDTDVISWLRQEMFFFVNGITERYKKLLGLHGFTQRVIDTEASSDDSPDHPKSNSDGESQQNEQTSSSEDTE